MTKILSFLAAFLFALMQGAMAWDGDGTSANPYLIQTVDDWNQLHTSVKDSPDQKVFENTYFRQTANLAVTQGIGCTGQSNGNRFCGIYDGGGRTLSCTLSNPDRYSSEAVAPFHRIGNASISNLRVTGSISGGIHTAGLVAYCETEDGQAATISNCRVSATISCLGSSTNDAHGGGIVGHAMSSTLTVENCLFDGQLAAINNGRGDIRLGAIVGWGDAPGGITLTGCVENGVYARTTADDQTAFAWFYSASGSTDYPGRLINCAYAGDIAYNSGADMVWSVTSADENVKLVFDETRREGSDCGAGACWTSTGGLVFISGTCFAPEGAMVRFRLRYPSGREVSEVSAAGKALTPDDDGVYSFRQEDTPVAVTVRFAWEGSGSKNDPYLISGTSDWRRLAEEVASGNTFEGKFFEMTRDFDAKGISVGDDFHPFSGTFDAYSHTLTFNRGVPSDGFVPSRYDNGFCAPFVRLDGATVRHLRVTGQVYSSHKQAAGIACLIDGDKPTLIDDCHVSSQLWADQSISADAVFGGIVGEVCYFCKGETKIQGCTFTGYITGFSNNSAGFIGWTHHPVTFDYCLFDPERTSSTDGCANFFRANDGLECTMTRCYYTKAWGKVQGEAVFRSIIVPDGCTGRIVSEPTVKFIGEKYWQSGATIELSAPDGVPFDHWATNLGGCWISDPWQRSGRQTVRDITREPSFTIETSMPKPGEELREMDGTLYRYLYRHDYHLYLSDETCREKRYHFDDKGELFFWSEKGDHIWVTAVVGWKEGKIPSDGAQIHNDLSGDLKDYTLTACIAPHAFDGCTELKTLYFKDTDANNYNAQTQFDFIIGPGAFANCPNLSEVKMMQYTTKGTNHWEALRPDQVSYVADNVFEGSPNANFSCDASEYQNYLGSTTWKNYQTRIIVYNHTNVDMTVNGAKYTYIRNTKGEPLKNSAEGNAEIMQTLRLWNADYQEFAANSLLTNASQNIWYTTVVGCDDSYLKSNDGVMRIYNDPGSYYNYKTIAIGRNAFKGSKELKAIEFWQTNGRSENSYTDMKLVIQNGAFANCSNLRELRMYYYTQDGDDHWTVLGPKDVIPGDNIFGIPGDDDEYDAETASYIPEDFKIYVAPELYNDFIDDPNWSNYAYHITPREYAPTSWDPIEEEGLTYDYASKVAGGASTNQVVTQNLSWWNVPIKIYEAVTLYEFLTSIKSAMAPVKRAFNQYKNVLQFEQTALNLQNQDVFTPLRNLGDAIKNKDFTDLGTVLATDPNQHVVRNTELSNQLIKKGILEIKPGGGLSDLRWTSNAHELVTTKPENYELLGRAIRAFGDNGYIAASNVFRDRVGVPWTKFLRHLTSNTLGTFVNGVGSSGSVLMGRAFSNFQAMSADMTEEEFQLGLVENIKANIHNVSYENTMVYTPDKKLIYHVYVDHINDIKRDSLTIYHDIGRAWNYRTVGIKKKAFQGNTHIQKIGFAENAVAGSDSYVPMMMAIPDSAFAGCTSLRRFNLIYKTRNGGFRGLGPENFILGGDHIFDGCDPKTLQIVIAEDRRQDFLNDELWNKYKQYFVYEVSKERTEYTEYGVNYAFYYDNNTTQRVSRVSGHKIEHLTAISADNEFLDEHQGSMGLFNDIGSYSNYKLDFASRKAFAGNDHLKTVSFWDLNGGDSYTTLNMQLGDSCFINCKNLKNIDMIYCVTDGTDHLETLKPSQVKAGVGMLDGSPDCIIKMLPQQAEWFLADSAWAKYQDRFRTCIIKPGDEAVLKALKNYRYYTPCCTPYYWDGYIDLARIGGTGYVTLGDDLQKQRDEIRSFAEFKQFESVGLDFVGSEWFRGCRKLTNIMLPKTIRTIQEYAFASCSALQEIELPAAVTEIAACAFADCKDLKTVVMRGKTPAKLTGTNQFQKNDGLRIYVPAASVDAYKTAWPEYKDYIVSDASYKINKVVTVTKPDELAEKLGLSVEFSYSGLTYGDEPRYVHGPYAKYDSLTISGPLGNVDLAVIRYLGGCDAYTGGGKATDGCLRYLNLSNASIKKTDDGYNYFNDDLTFNGGRYKITDDDVLPVYIFQNCTALETIILPKTLKDTNARLFGGCTGLKRLAVTSGLDDYDSRLFSDGLLDYPLETLVFSADKVAQSSRKDPWGKSIGYVYTKKSTLGEYMGQTYLTYQARNIEALFEEDAVTDALINAGLYFPEEFMRLQSLDSIFTGNKDITRFDEFARFSNVRQLSAGDFRDCSAMRIIALPDSLQLISSTAFDGCTRLDSIYISTDKVPELEANAFQSLPASFRIFVPKNLCKLYREKWAEYADHINVDMEYGKATPVKVVTVTEPNTLGKALGLETNISATGTIWSKHLHGVKGDYSDITHLKVIGPISSTDFDLMRYLAGYCPWRQCSNYSGHLEYIDLYDAQIKNSHNIDLLGKGTVQGGVVTIHTNENELPSCAFQNAINLKTLILPKTCKRVDTRAMIGCENMETLVIGDDMEKFNWDALDDGASLTRMYILAKKKPEITAEFAVWRWLCNNYNPTFDAFYVRPSMYSQYVSDANYTGSSWQRTNNISTGVFEDDESFCAFAAHAAANADDLTNISSVEGWFDQHPGAKDLSQLAYTAIDSLHKATIKPLTQLERIAMPLTLQGIEDGAFADAKHLRSVDMMLCDSTDFVTGLHNGGFSRIGIDTLRTLVYVPEAYGQSDGANIVAGSDEATLHAKAFHLVDSLNYFVPHAFEADRIENTRQLTTSPVPYTFCVPYKLKVPAYARAYQLSERSGSSLIFKEVTGELEAMVPYLLKVVGNKRLRKNSTTLNTAIKQDIPASGGSTYGQQVDAPGYSLRGTFDPISNADASNLGAYILQSDGDWHPVASATDAEKKAEILPYRAFLLPSARHAPERIGMTLEDATDIDTIETIDADGTRRCYDLQGRELHEKPAHGIFIQGGRKILVE